MNLIKMIIMGAGLLLMWNGYQEGKDPTPPAPAPSPDNPSPAPVVVPNGGADVHLTIDPPVQIAPVPSDPNILNASAPIRQTLKGHAEDALKLSWAFKGWADLIAPDSDIKSTSQFQVIQQKAMEELLRKHQLAGKYPLATPINAVMIAAFTPAGLVENGVLKAEAWSPAASTAAANAFNAISYQCFNAYLDSVVVPNK